MSGYISGKTKRTVWTPKDRLDKKQATAGLPAWSHGNDNFTKLMLNCDSLADSSVGHTSHPYTPIAGYFDGNGDYLTASNSADFNVLSTDDFTFEAWVYFTQLGSAFYTLFATTTSTAAETGMFINVNTYTLQFLIANAGSWGFSSTGITLTSANLNQWCHIAYSRQSGTLRGFLNGKLMTSNANTSAISSSLGCSIGATTNNVYNFFGNMSDVRWSKGIARYTADFSVPIAPLREDSFTKLLLPMNEGLKPIAYDSLGKKSISTGTSTTVKNLNKLPVSDVAGFFQASGDYLSVDTNTSTMNLQTNTTWTIEFWVNPSNTGATQDIVTKRSSYGLTLYISSTGNLAAYSSIGGGWNGMWNGTSLGVLQFNSWNFVQISRNGTTYIANINGVQTYTITSPTLFYDVDTSPFVIAGGVTWGTFKGFVADFRFSTSVRSNIVPTSLFQNDASTQLLIHMDQVGVSFVDSSSNNKTILPVGNAKHLACQPGDTKAFVGDGTSSSIVSSQYSTDFDFNTNQFTVEGWVYYTTSPINGFIFGSSNWSTGWGFGLNPSNYLAFMLNGSWGLSSTITAPVGRWFHLAFTRDISNNIKLFLDGNIIASGANASSLTAGGTNFNIFQANTMYAPSGTTVAWTHVVNGTALYTDNFTPPTLPRVHKDSKVLIVAGEDARSFNDFSQSAKVVTRYGDTIQTNKIIGNSGASAIFDTSSPVSGRVFNLNSSSGYFVVPVSTDIQMGNIDFTVDFWAKRTSFPSVCWVMGQCDAAGNNTTCSFAFDFLNQYARAGFYIGGTNYAATDSTTTTDSNWHHYAIVRCGDLGILFKDGIKVASSTVTGALNTSSAQFRIGMLGEYGNSGFVGQMTQIRISKGIARWTNNFVPPKQNYLAN
ncbi:LamG domain-containing protein [Fundidesulfovibrio putealis]|uniref:LamG domain-containing protein n=1 Tax=Fundidesulfovibrio putealis TaxID=270496 RepID=UPI00042A666E|nr:LamG domain-containing protein [Fundidesulfovibrio putealis]